MSFQLELLRSFAIAAALAVIFGRSLLPAARRAAWADPDLRLHQRWWCAARGAYGVIAGWPLGFLLFPNLIALRWFDERDGS